MELDKELLKDTIRRNPEGHEKLTGRYYLTLRGVEFVYGSQPKPVGAIRIPSFGDDHPFKDQQLSIDELAEALANQFVKSLGEGGRTKL